MNDRVFFLAEAIGARYGEMVASFAMMTGLANDFKAARTVIGYTVLVFMSGIGVASAYAIWLGLPGRVETVEAAIRQMSQDLCVIRAVTESIDPVPCLREIR
jgi:hypothetical protein